MNQLTLETFVCPSDIQESKGQILDVMKKVLLATLS